MQARRPTTDVVEDVREHMVDLLSKVVLRKEKRWSSTAHGHHSTRTNNNVILSNELSRPVGFAGAFVCSCLVLCCASPWLANIRRHMATALWWSMALHPFGFALSQVGRMRSSVVVATKNRTGTTTQPLEKAVSISTRTASEGSRHLSRVPWQMRRKNSWTHQRRRNPSIRQTTGAAASHFTRSLRSIYTSADCRRLPCIL